MQPLFKTMKYYPHSGNTHVGEQLFKEGICLPSGSNMEDRELQRVIQCIKNAL